MIEESQHEFHPLSIPDSRGIVPTVTPKGIPVVDKPQVMAKQFSKMVRSTMKKTRIPKMKRKKLDVKWY